MPPAACSRLCSWGSGWACILAKSARSSMKSASVIVSSASSLYLLYLLTFGVRSLGKV